MLLEQQPAYVLHARPYRETSLLLECLTQDHGRLGVIARGVRSERSRLPRSQLEPFQLLLMNLHLRGELATVRASELASSSLRLIGDAGIAGLYVNELVVRLTERQDPHPALFLAYAETLARLARGDTLAWQLRRFERDLLAALGYALQLDVEADSGDAIDPDGFYRYRAEQGAMRCNARDSGALRGSDLSNLRTDCIPDPQGLLALRGMMRDLIRFHLGGGELRAWRVLSGALVRR